MFTELLVDLKGVTEQELVVRLQQGDIKAFEEIYERYWWTMYVIAHRKTKSKEVAEEMVQDLSASIWKNGNSLRFTFHWLAT